MTTSKILLTGATGNLGAAILEQLLSAGFTVDAVVRSFEKSKSFLEKKYPSAILANRLILTEIPDMAKPGVFDEPASKADAIIHAATPLANDNFLKTMIEPTWAINESLFNAAAASKTVKRIVITGTIVAIHKLPEDVLSGRTFSEKDFNPISLEEGTENRLNAYQYSKTYSEQKSYAWIKEHKPAFDIVFLLPSCILGRSIQQGYSPAGDSMGGIAQVANYYFSGAQDYFPHYIHTDDVIRMHIQSLDPTLVPGNQRYLGSAGVVNLDKIAVQLREKFPNLKDRLSAFNADTTLPAQLMQYDLSKMKKVFGTEWKSAYEAVEDVIADVLAYEAGTLGKE